VFAQDATASHKPILTTDAPAPIGPYSQAILSGDTLFCSGQTGLNPKTGALVDGDVSAQTEQALKNLGAVLHAAGFDFNDVARTTVFLVDINDFSKMNEAYAHYFGDAKPARSTVAVAALPRGARVEIDAIARNRLRAWRQRRCFLNVNTLSMRAVGLSPALLAGAGCTSARLVATGAVATPATVMELIPEVGFDAILSTDKILGRSITMATVGSTIQIASAESFTDRTPSKPAHRDARARRDRAPRSKLRLFAQGSGRGDQRRRGRPGRTAASRTD
jgi:2-iminobutanoate/2-iminopropanoate deaminase